MHTPQPSLANGRNGMTPSLQNPRKGMTSMTFLIVAAGIQLLLFVSFIGFFFSNEHHRQGELTDMQGELHRLRSLSGSGDEPFGGGIYAETRRLRLRFARSKIHAWGVFADEPVRAGDFVLEYRGEEIGIAMGDKRALQYEAEGRIDYLFRVDDETIAEDDPIPSYDACFQGF